MTARSQPAVRVGGVRTRAPTRVEDVRSQPAAAGGDPVRTQAVARVGGVQSQGSARVGEDVQSQDAVRAGWMTIPQTVPTTLDQLADVDAPPDVPGLLERQDSGRVIPVTRTEVIAAHVASLTPHPVYDDLPSLTLLFENGLV